MKGAKAPMFFRTNNSPENASKIEIVWSYYTERPTIDDNDGQQKYVGELVKIKPYGNQFSHDSIYIGLYFWKDCSLNLGFSFGSDYFNKGQLNTKDLLFRNMTIKSKIDAKKKKH